MQSTYAVWIGQPVILQLAAADLCVPLRGIIVAETGDCIRFRVEQAWDIDIYYDSGSGTGSLVTDSGQLRSRATRVQRRIRVSQIPDAAKHHLNSCPIDADASPTLCAVLCDMTLPC